MDKADFYKAYFSEHPAETELYHVAGQVFMGSQKVFAQNWALSNGIADVEQYVVERADYVLGELPKKNDVSEKGDETVAPVAEVKPELEKL